MKTKGEFDIMKSARVALAFVLSVGAASAVLQAADKKIDLYDTTIPTVVQTPEGPRTLNVPVWNVFTGLYPYHCSAYGRKAAEKLFGKEYSYSDAWDRGDNDKLVAEVGDKTLDELADRGILTPGMLVGLENPNTMLRGKVDSKGNMVRYTHIEEYLGQNDEGDALFAGQYGFKTQVRTESEILRAGLIPREIIDEK